MLELFFMTYLLAALSGLLVGSISMMLTISRSVMFGLTLLHSILGGAILGVFLNSAVGLGVPVPLISTLTALILSVMVAELVERGLPEDTATAFSVAVATTITIVFGYLASHVSSTAVAEAWLYVTGTSSIASPEDIVKTSFAIVIVLPVIHIIFRELRYIAFDEDGAKAMGLNVRFYRYVFYGLAALAASTLSSTIGVLVTHVVLAVPGAIALKYGKRVGLPLCYGAAVAVMLSGYLLARSLAIPPSGGVGIISATLILTVVSRGRG